ncbi:MAG: GLUG motif-containing protein [Oscillospiraceae bacterium]
MRKFTSVLLALVLCAALLCIGAAAAGSGDVIEIDTPEKLAEIGVDKEYPLDGNYILTADINLGGDTNPWNPIGTFTGTFDGNGHTISELYINSNSEYAGLFGYVGADGTVKNLTVEGVVNRDATQLEDAYTGGIVGYNGGTVEGCTNKCDVTVSANDYACTGGITGINYGTVSYCNNSGCVSGQTTVSDMPSVNTGGVVGYNAAGDISNCYNTGAVTGSGGGSYYFLIVNTGGIVGQNYDGTVSYCYNTGVVTGSGGGSDHSLIVSTGGVVGQNYDGTVSDCYNTGAVTAIGGGYAGGVAGFNGYGAGTVESCYNIGTVRVESEGSGSAGGVVGYNQPGSDLEHIGIVTGCYYLKQDGLDGIGYGDDSGTGASGLDKEQFAVPDNFSNDWNFTNTWIIDTPSEGGFARPMLRYNLETAEGSGTESDPYIIPDLEMLEFYRDMINTGSDSKYNRAHYILTANINLGGGEKPWTPIGSNKDHAFTGTFDGNGHTISGLYINNGDSVYAGLFGYVGRGGMIKGLTVEGKITISGSTSCVGGIAGIVSSSGQVGMSVLTDSDDSETGIIDCISNVTINVTYNGSSGLSVEGIVGSCGGATISGCENYGDVSVVGASESDIVNIGGIVGYSGSSTIIRNCCNTGAVSVQDAEKAYAGGIMGQSINTTLSGCCNTGAVSVQDAEKAYAGGIMGQSINTTLSGCYNTGAVSVQNVEEANLGGLVGQSSEDTAVSSCYNTGAVNAEDAEYANLGGVVGENDGSVSNCYNTGDLTAENVEEVDAGGVVGLVNRRGTVGNCYNTGDVSAKASSGDSVGDELPPVMAGGVVGYKGGGTVTYCYYLAKDGLNGIGYGGESDDNATPLSKDQFAVPGSFTDWNFTNTWTIADMGGFERPVLIDNKETVVTYTVTVNGSYAGETGEGSYLAGASVTVSAGERAGYSFAGWTAEGVDLADESAENVTFTMPANDVTLTAEWDYIVTPGDPTYRPIIDEPENGGVTTLPSRPEAGDTVTVNPEPDEGYEVDEIIVTDKDGNPVEVTRNPDGSYSFTQPEGAVTIEVTFRPASGLPFTDVAEGDWFYDYVEYVYANGLMDGTSDTAFEPNANMTRAMVWAILARIDGETVTGANWVETAREWAMANGVSDGENANGYVTREQLATMLWRYAGEPASDYSLSAFTDAANVSDYAATAMAWAVEHGIITGVTDTTIEPQGTATRAQCAAMLMRFVENVK